MDISLWDLGCRRQTALLQWRAASLNNPSFGRRNAGGIVAFPILPALPRRLGPLTRLWARGADSPPETVGRGLEAMRGQVYGIMGGMFGGSTGFWLPGTLLAASGRYEAGVFMMAIGAIMNGVGLWVPSYWLRRLCRSPVSAAEVEALQAAASDDLEQAYLRLVGDAVRQAVTPEAAERVRAALRAVGEAIDALPAVTVPRASVDSQREEAVRARAEAHQEADPVVAASHQRRADALGRSAEAALRSQMLTRRGAALREEMCAQIESLRLGLAGFETASGDVAGLASLAEAVRTVATESLSVADARAELDASLSGGSSPQTTLRQRAGDGL